MHSLPSVSKPTGHSRIFWVITLPTCLWETEEKAMWELPILSWTFIRAEWWWHILRDRFRSNSTCTLYQVTRNQHNTPGILSWENWQSSSYLRIGKQKTQLLGDYQPFLHIRRSMSTHSNMQQYSATISHVLSTKWHKDTPGFSSDHPTYYSLGNRKKAAVQESPIPLALVCKIVHTLCTKFRSDFTRSPPNRTHSSTSELTQKIDLCSPLLSKETATVCENYQSFLHLCGRGSWSWRWQIDRPANSSGDTFPPARHQSSPRPTLPELHIPRPSQIGIQWGTRSTTTTTTPLDLRFGEPSARRRNERSSHVLFCFRFGLRWQGEANANAMQSKSHSAGVERPNRMRRERIVASPRARALSSSWRPGECKERASGAWIRANFRGGKGEASISVVLRWQREVYDVSR